MHIVGGWWEYVYPLAADIKPLTWHLTTPPSPPPPNSPFPFSRDGSQSPDNFPVVWKHGELAMVGAMFDRSAYAYMLESGDEVGVFPQDVTWDTDDGEAWGAGDEIFCHGKYVITTAKRTRLWDVERYEFRAVPFGLVGRWIVLRWDRCVLGFALSVLYRYGRPSFAS